jgi:hypothetical protein
MDVSGKFTIGPDVFRPAVAHWWNSKTTNTDDISRSQGGTRDSNLRGDTMDGFRDVIITHLKDAGISEDDIFAGSQLSRLASNLPSYFRASKNWDLIVVKNSLFKHLDQNLLRKPDGEPQLLAAIEFKSQEGSIGNNQNNRIEESIGNAADFWDSYENRNFIQVQPRPWLGYLFCGRYDESLVDKPVEINQPHFPSDKKFTGPNPADRTTKMRYLGPSYAQRYCIFLERMILKKMYDGACFITTHESIKDDKENHRCINPNLSGERFLDSLIRYVTAYY